MSSAPCFPLSRLSVVSSHRLPQFLSLSPPPLPNALTCSIRKKARHDELLAIEARYRTMEEERAASEARASCARELLSSMLGAGQPQAQAQPPGTAPESESKSEPEPEPEASPRPVGELLTEGFRLDLSLPGGAPGGEGFPRSGPAALADLALRLSGHVWSLRGEGAVPSLRLAPTAADGGGVAVSGDTAFASGELTDGGGIFGLPFTVRFQFEEKVGEGRPRIASLAWYSSFTGELYPPPAAAAPGPSPLLEAYVLPRVISFAGLVPEGAQSK